MKKSSKGSLIATIAAVAVGVGAVGFFAYGTLNSMDKYFNNRYNQSIAQAVDTYQNQSEAGLSSDEEQPSDVAPTDDGKVTYYDEDGNPVLSVEDLTKEEEKESVDEDNTSHDVGDASDDNISQDDLHSDVSREENSLQPLSELCVKDSDGNWVYVVKRGDWLSRVSGQLGWSVQELAEYNHISNPHLIYTDQSIRIPN